jgi:hypothetical protein
MSKRKRYLKKKDLALRYGDTTIKTVDRMWKDGRIPEPDIWNAKSPLWDESNLEKHERLNLTAPRARRTTPRARTGADDDHDNP